MDSTKNDRVAAEEEIISFVQSSSTAEVGGSTKKGNRLSGRMTEERKDSCIKLALGGTGGSRKEEGVQIIKPAVIETLSVGWELRARVSSRDSRHHRRIGRGWAVNNRGRKNGSGRRVCVKQKSTYSSTVCAVMSQNFQGAKQRMMMKIAVEKDREWSTSTDGAVSFRGTGGRGGSGRSSSTTDEGRRMVQVWSEESWGRMGMEVSGGRNVCSDGGMGARVTGKAMRS